MFLGRLARKISGSPSNPLGGGSLILEDKESTSPLRAKASNTRDKDRDADVSNGPRVQTRIGQGKSGVRTAKGAGAWGPRPGLGLSSHVRRLMVPLVALFGISLGSLLGGFMALRHAATCSSSASECWELRGRTFTRKEAGSREGRGGGGLDTGWMNEGLNLHTRGRHEQRKTQRKEKERQGVRHVDKGVASDRSVGKGKSARDLEAKLLQEMGYKEGALEELGEGGAGAKEESAAQEATAGGGVSEAGESKEQQPEVPPGNQGDGGDLRGTTGAASGGQGMSNGAESAGGEAGASRRPVERKEGLPKQGAESPTRVHAAGVMAPAAKRVLPAPRVLPQLQDSDLFQQALAVESPFDAPSWKEDTGSREDGDEEEGTPRPTRKGGRIAFLFLAKRDLPLARLWRRFLIGHKRHYSIYIHASPEFDLWAGKLPRAFQGRQVLSKDLKWGRMSMVDAERRLLANALLNPDNTRFALLSDSCIPIYNFSYTYNHLTNTPFSFVRGSVYKGQAGTGRWNSNFLPLVPKSRFRKGLQWWVLSREAARAVVGDTKYYPLFKDSCTPMTKCFPTEHYIQTMLYETLETRMANRSLTWVDWSRGYTPLMFEAADIGPAVVRKVRAKRSCLWNDAKAYCYLFARKFKASTLEPLLNLTSKLGYT